MNVGSLLPWHSRYRPDHVAVICGEHRLTFAELDDRVNRLANALLSLGLRKGEKLALVLPNCVELLYAYRAAALLGVVAVPLCPLLRGTGLISLLKDSDSLAVIASSAMIDALDEARAELPQIPGENYILIDSSDRRGYRGYSELTSGRSGDAPPVTEISDDDVYNIIYSSGTTGSPK